MKKIYYVFAIILLFAAAALAQETTSTSYFAVTWSPDSKYLTFTKMQMTNSKPPVIKADVYTMKADGTEMKKITGDEQNEFTPSWSKNKRIFFRSSSNKEGNIFSVKPDGTDLIQVTKNIGRSSNPAVSDDGKKIAFNVESVDHKPQIYVMNADGSNVSALTNDNTLAFYNPVWSPDGKRIVYYVEKGDQKDQIWTMNADGTNQTLLTANIAHNFYPSWSVDGKRIIFCSNRDGEEAVIYSMKADGSDIRRLLKTNSAYARYSPNGKRIVFVSGKFPNTNIFVADADGTNEVNLTAAQK
jgi:TolB protein